MESPDPRKCWPNTRNPFLLLVFQAQKKPTLRTRARHGLCLEGDVFSSWDACAELAAGSPTRAGRAGGVQLLRLKGKI